MRGMMRLSNCNAYMSSRSGQGIPHNIGVKAQEKISEAGREMKANPPKILAHTAKKFGKAKAEKQRKAILLSKARQAGAKIPLKS